MTTIIHTGSTRQNGTTQVEQVVPGGRAGVLLILFMVRPRALQEPRAWRALRHLCRHGIDTKVAASRAWRFQPTSHLRPRLRPCATPGSRPSSVVARGATGILVPMSTRQHTRIHGHLARSRTHRLSRPGRAWRRRMTQTYGSAPQRHQLRERTEAKQAPNDHCKHSMRAIALLHRALINPQSVRNTLSHSACKLNAR